MANISREDLHSYKQTEHFLELKKMKREESRNRCDICFGQKNLGCYFKFFKRNLLLTQKEDLLLLCDLCARKQIKHLARCETKNQAKRKKEWIKKITKGKKVSKTLKFYPNVPQDVTNKMQKSEEKVEFSSEKIV